MVSLPTLRRVALRTVAAGLAVQGAVIAALITTDLVKKKRRSARSGFPRPGTFGTEVGDTSTTTYTYGEDLFEDMLDAIRKAENRIFLETYLWKDDEVGTAFRDALNDAAERGVDVYVIYDHFGNLVVPPSFYTFHPDVHVFRFPALGPSLQFGFVSATGLTHRKILLVDNETGFIGGYNIGSLYATEWRDTHVRLVGPAAFELGHSFAQVWNHLAARQPTLSPENKVHWDSRILAVNNIPADLVYPIRSVYLDAISRAQHHIYLTTAYFIPDRRILTGLIEASRRGVDVQIIVPEESNHIITDRPSRGLYSSLLQENIKTLRFRNAMTPAKTATIDGRWSIVGTANIDRLSLAFNYETNLEVQDRGFAADMEKIFAIDRDNCVEVDAEEWGRRHPAARFAETVLVPLRPLL
ncbi:phospholipase [Arthrobacter sp. RIT-PI-e]|nr:phospholipase [Arthrobacter sp. RIT-PI-e]